MRAFLRSVALSVPPIRRLHMSAVAANQASRDLEDRLVAMRAELDETTQYMHRARAELAKTGDLVWTEKAQAEQAAATEKARADRAQAECEALELQLYVLRSDVQRAAARNEGLLHELRRVEDDVKRRAEEAETTLALASKAAHEAGNQIVDRIEPLLSWMRDAKRFGGAGDGGLISTEGRARALYLELLEKILTGVLWQDPPMDPWSEGYDPAVRAIGRDWPSTAHTMIGEARLRNLRVLCEDVLARGVKGDFLEAGVWRGGACILMRAILLAYGDTTRSVWVADSFEGLPPPNASLYPADQGDQHSTHKELAVSLEQVQGNFRQYDLLDAQVRFLKGWFEDTLPTAPVDRLAVLRLDGDMYSSTIQTLDALYDKVSPGGFIIVDDYILAGCKKAVDDFRRNRGITNELTDVDGAAVYWQK